MTDQRDPFLAQQIGRSTPPDHGPTFWADLEAKLAAPSPGRRRPFSPTDSPYRLMAVAAVAAVLAGLTIGVIVARNGDGVGIETSPADPGQTSSDDPGPGGSSTTTPPTSTPPEPAGDVLDLTDAVELDTSLDDSLRLMAVPSPDEPGCEGTSPVWRLFWVDGDLGYPATDEVFASTPTLTRGDDGRLALVDRCEQSTPLFVTTETEPGVLGPVRHLAPVGWEGAAIRDLAWQADSDVVELVVVRPGADGDPELTRLEVDSTTGEVLTSTPVDPDGGDQPATTCSATDLTDPVLSSGHPWSDLAAEIQRAALDCDYDRLADLAGPGFTSSYGAPGGFAQQLRSDEDLGYDPTRKLVLLLEADPGELPPENHLTWPAFFACESTCGMDEDEVRRIGYTDDDIAGFRDFGGYIGYRVLFAPDGDGSYTWSVYVAGD